MKTEPKRKGVMIDFGLGGHGIDFAPVKMAGGTVTGSLSGYEGPESFQRRSAQGEYDHYDLEGAVVIDKRAVLEKDPTPAYKSPLLCTDMEEGKVNRFADIAKGSLVLEAMRGDRELARQWGVVGAMALSEAQELQPQPRAGAAGLRGSGRLHPLVGQARGAAWHLSPGQNPLGRRGRKQRSTMSSAKVTFHVVWDSLTRDGPAKSK